ncbi:hypothetical protein BP6252_10373 [Coleophoma cylindrospora]|uniref:Uncharacterized protein n=1 Tax=Coleophoma cylindrospora TaxID=1849047 RepID=A0A3D8QSG3_9HELO|nr:hypothetical protein BP6252_10373 [Coleophoma cylindrospora]
MRCTPSPSHLSPLLVLGSAWRGRDAWSQQGRPNWSPPNLPSGRRGFTRSRQGAIAAARDLAWAGRGTLSCRAGWRALFCFSSSLLWSALICSGQLCSVLMDGWLVHSQLASPRRSDGCRATQTVETHRAGLPTPDPIGLGQRHDEPALPDWCSSKCNLADVTYVASSHHQTANDGRWAFPKGRPSALVARGFCSPSSGHFPKLGSSPPAAFGIERLRSLLQTSIASLRLHPSLFLESHPLRSYTPLGLSVSAWSLWGGFTSSDCTYQHLCLPRELTSPIHARHQREILNPPEPETSISAKGRLGSMVWLRIDVHIHQRSLDCLASSGLCQFGQPVAESYGRALLSTGVEPGGNGQELPPKLRKKKEVGLNAMPAIGRGTMPWMLFLTDGQDVKSISLVLPLACHQNIPNFQHRRPPGTIMTGSRNTPDESHPVSRL